MNAAASRHHRAVRARRACALGAVAIAALLATTACRPTDDAADGAESTQQPSASASATATPPGAGSGGGSEEDAGVALCTLDDLSISATKYGAKDEPTRHLLLVATNTSDKKCDVQNAPEVTLGDAQGPAPVLDGASPGEPVTLAPGEKAYAGLRATGGHMDTYDVASMTVTLGSPGGEAEAEPPVDLTMPVESFPADDGQRVTPWAGTEGLAMRPITTS
ncbi:hypothetical protein GCM10010293_27440 [Streptomyces griseoflavus]|uniref:DUF4232 domain-containing protein n=1 Tax=Streptomyces griseoflavus TaxID=35619 RepID=UPI00167CC214|nr:DUF4232 domain-containing protein [Streptomyces griseoflavus]GGV28166.1 hypothetical protein GCM10010293_27440 [Streptomyces griseoflavus]